MSTFQTEFVLRGDPREVNSAAVSQLDGALAVAAGCPLESVLHGIDPKRILTFANGGPPVWSVAQGRCANGDVLSVTYGLSQFIDPAAPFGHEMSIRVASDGSADGPQWPMFFLRALARYQITSGRELRAGEVMPFGESITRTAMAPEHKASMPDSPLQAIAVVDDPLMQSVRRVYGLHADELDLGQAWSPAGLMSLVAERTPTLSTDVARGTWSRDPVIRAGVDAGRAREGSSAGAALVAGLHWEKLATGVAVHFPAGCAKTVIDLIDGRIGFGRTLLLHDVAQAPCTEVGFTVSDSDFFEVRSPAMVEIGVNKDSMLFAALRMAAQETNPSAVTMRLTSPT